MFKTLIDCKTLSDNLANPDWAIIDTRFSLGDTSKGERDYHLSRIPGALYAHLDRDLSGAMEVGVTGRHPLPERNILTQTFSSWGISPETQVVAYDDNIGAVAARLWWLARWLGHERIAVLDGGFSAWNESGHKLATTSASTCNQPTTAATDETELLQSKPLLKNKPEPYPGKSALVELINSDEAASGNWLLVDAREAERYAGVHEPIDSVAGHIPGAVNRAFAENIGSDKRFLAPAILRERFTAVEQQAGDRPLAHYCGSGVTAAHNILAMVHAGLTPGALYAGSFSEWITKDGEQFSVARLGD
ncbi:MAG: sulfurtransferase [Granulosicoccus sp.]